MLKRFMCCLLIAASGLVFAAPQIALTSNDAATLRVFFEQLIENSESGYVLYGKKPVCIFSFYDNSTYLDNPELMRLSAAHWAAKSALDNLPSESNLVLRVHEDRGYGFLVNRKMFLEVVQDNLVLFQYVLGPMVTPERLLEAFLEGPFDEVLKFDKVLIGIVLGYGAENSIIVSRIENLSDAILLFPDVPPFGQNVIQAPSQPTVLDSAQLTSLFLYSTPEKLVDCNVVRGPSFGFSSLSEELEDLSEQVVISSLPLRDEAPDFIFGCIPESEKTQQLIAELERTQVKIKKLLKSPNFLQEVLAQFYEGQEVAITDSSDFCFARPSKDVLHRAIAKMAMNRFQGYDPSCFPHFYQGLMSPSDEEQNSQGHYSWRASFPECLRNISMAKTRLEEANTFFRKVARRHRSKTSSYPYLYCETVRKGSGKALKGAATVCIDYEIYDPDGKCIACASEAVVDLQDTIPGFAHGMQKMRTGEKRAIYIHPSLAYGVHTWLERGIYLKALVELKEIQSESSELAPPQPMDLSFITKDQFQRECAKEYRENITSLGQDMGQFICSCPNIDLDLVGQQLKALDDDSLLTEAELDAINHMLWNLYFAQGE